MREANISLHIPGKNFHDPAIADFNGTGAAEGAAGD